MYNRLSLICLIFLGTLTCAYAQNKIESTGNVGIGTTNPTHQLEVLSPAISGAETMFKISVSDAPNDFLSFTNGTGVSGTYIPFIKARFTSDNRPALFLRGQITPATDNGGWAVTIFDALSDNSYVQNRNLFAWRNYTTELMTMSVEGNLGIGTKNPTHKLEVNGNIRAHEIKLETGNWPDYVFGEAYQLPTLEETKDFIEQNGHLPGFKAAKEYQEEGVNMMELNQKLLEKIEELTLQLIKVDEERKKDRKVYETQIQEIYKELKFLKEDLIK